MSENQLNALQSRSNETETTLNNQLQEHQQLQGDFFPTIHFVKRCVLNVRPSHVVFAASNVCLQDEVAALASALDGQKQQTSLLTLDRDAQLRDLALAHVHTYAYHPSYHHLSYYIHLKVIIVWIISDMSSGRMRGAAEELHGAAG